MEEVERIAREVKAPLLSNQVPGGRTPALTVSELEKLGYRMVIFPVVGFMAATLAMRPPTDADRRELVEMLRWLAKLVRELEASSPGSSKPADEQLSD